MKKEKTIIIIGGGAAGMMAAYFAKASAHNVKVILLEKNSYFGVKVIISGGGRCNVTTGITDFKKILENYPRGAKFLKTAMYGFSPRAVMDWFELRGVKLKIEEDLRVFPVSNNGKEVVGALEKALNEKGVEIKCNLQIKEVKKSQNGFEIVSQNGEIFCGNSLIITTGGNTYHQTGSTGDGYDFAKVFGHTITKLTASLGAVKLQENFCSQLAGLSFGNVGLSFLEYETMKIKYRYQGGILFTHQGISGPGVFALMAKAAYEKFLIGSKLKIDFYPLVTSIDLGNQFLKSLKLNRGKLFKNVLGYFVPQRLADLFIETECLIEKGKDLNLINASEVSKNLRKKVVYLLKNWELVIQERIVGDEFVTAGGVNLDEVDSKTMQSKLVPGLFFAGEILDVDGFTGGFNLQAAWACGALAGKSANQF